MSVPSQEELAREMGEFYQRIQQRPKPVYQKQPVKVTVTTTVIEDQRPYLTPPDEDVAVAAEST